MEITELKGKVCSGCISEDLVMEYCDQNSLSTMQFSSICEKLILSGVSIVSSEEYTQCILQQTEQKDVSPKRHKNEQVKFSSIVSEFSKLNLEEKYKCLSKLAYIIAQEENRQVEGIKNCFIETFKQKYLQYSYIAVLVKAFFEVVDPCGKASLQAVVKNFQSFYDNRSKRNVVVEQSDSVFAKGHYDENDVRKIVLFNPMKRSFLKDYLIYDKENDNIVIDSFLWDALTEDDISLILRIADEKLKIYFDKISL